MSGSYPSGKEKKKNPAFQEEIKAHAKKTNQKTKQNKKKYTPRHGAIWGLHHGLDGMKPARCWREIGKDTCLHIRISPKNWFEVVC